MLPSARLRHPAVLGAAFLMATSAIGPGFLTQTTVFTEQLEASFGFVILVSILLDIGVQLNTWRVLVVSELRTQELLNKLLPGLGYLLAAFIAFGGMVFNIGNMAGCGLGLQVITGLPPVAGAVVSCIIAILIFLMKEAGNAMDVFTKMLGMLMILLMLYVVLGTHPPVAAAIKYSVFPQKVSLPAIVTLVGGTVGGYISFAGAHRLLDAGIRGSGQVKTVSRSAVNGIFITSTMRVLLFLAVLSVVATGIIPDRQNPAASVFRIAAGEAGYRFFGVVMWSAGITSVVGASYTSVSFIRSMHPFIQQNQRWFILLFIVLSTLLFVLIGKPVQLLVAAGAVNGLILPLALTCILIASRSARLMHGYKHPLWMQSAGWVVVVAVSWMGIITLYDWLR